MIISASTVKDSRDNVEKFVRRNLLGGIDHLVLFLDAPLPEVEELLDGHPDVTYVRAHGDWWGSMDAGGLNERQINNAALISRLAAGFDWAMRLPAGAEREGLELVGSRPCLYGEGKIAHIMYRHNGEPLSLFMLPRTERPEQLVETLGHECAIWSSQDRTFVLVSRESRADVEKLAQYVHASMR